jgi:hypothetical protein
VTETTRLLALPWEQEPVRVVVVREYREYVWVRLVEPHDGQVEDAFPVRKAWLT